MFIRYPVTDDNILDCFYKISPPPDHLVRVRDEKVKKLKKQMGDKYLLAPTNTRGRTSCP
jgi:hypothetical protein